MKQYKVYLVMEDAFDENTIQNIFAKEENANIKCIELNSKDEKHYKYYVECWDVE